MKKYFISLAALLLTAGMVNGQNKLTVSDFSVPQNDAGTLSVNFEFDVEGSYTGYQFNLELPSDLAFDLKSGTDVSCVKGECHTESHAVSANLSDGLVKVAALSTSSAPLTGKSGILLTFKVRPSTENLAVGTTYTGTIKDIVLVPVEGTKQKLDAASFTVTIAEPAGPVMLDETSATPPEASDGEVNVTVKRKLVGGKWNTLCLPFAMTAERVKAAFGDDVKLAAFDSYEASYDADDNVTGISIKFSEIDLSEEDFDANYPYLVKPSHDISEFTTAAAIDPDEEGAVAEYDNGRTGRNRKVLGSMVGTYRAGTTVPENALFIDDGKFWYSRGKTKMKAYRAYFDLTDVLSSLEDAASAVVLSLDDSTTGIPAMQVRGDGTSEIVYNLNGQRVLNPKHGLYIKNHKKVVIR